MASYGRKQLERYLSTLEIKADRVLDVGGAQLPITKRVKSFQVGDYKIMDLENPHEGKKPDIVGDIEMHTPAWFAQCGEFDVVFCLQVMEYIADPMYAVQNLFKLTKSGGVLYISFPFIYPVHRPEGKDFLRYTRYGACEILKRAGFSIDHIFSFSANGSLHNVWLTEGMRPDPAFPAQQEVGFIIRATKK